MDSMKALAMAEANRGKPLKTFDWVKAAHYLKNNNIKNASAGLYSDLEWTGGYILTGGKIVESEHMYLASIWALPVLVIGEKEIECWEYDSKYDAKTVWPQEARDIYNGRIGKTE